MEVADYLKEIVTPMLKHPDNFIVITTKDDMGILLSVDVDTEDMGILIGRAGETAKAIRHLVRIVGLVSNARVSVKVNEPKNSTHVEMFNTKI